jgi:hypothetical protein
VAPSPPFWKSADSATPYFSIRPVIRRIANSIRLRGRIHEYILLTAPVRRNRYGITKWGVCLNTAILFGALILVRACGRGIPCSGVTRFKEHFLFLEKVFVAQYEYPFEGLCKRAPCVLAERSSQSMMYMWTSLCFCRSCLE